MVLTYTLSLLSVHCPLHVKNKPSRPGELILNVKLKSFDNPVVFSYLAVCICMRRVYMLLDSHCSSSQPDLQTQNRSQTKASILSTISMVDRVSTPATTPGQSPRLTNSSRRARRDAVKSMSGIGFAPQQEGQSIVDYTCPTRYWISDAEVRQNNLVEEKHLKLTLSLSNPLIDRELKPNAAEIRRINTILDYPPLRDINIEDKGLLWRFRYHLTSNKRALVKFLRCVDWSHTKEEKEATMLLEEWAEIDTVDALLLLSRHFVGVEIVRSYAIKILKKADDETLLDILLQLVQAVRYEPKGEHSELAYFLVDRACLNFYIANYFNWFVVVESEDKKFGDMFNDLHHNFWIQLKKRSADELLEQIIKQDRFVKSVLELGKMLKNDKDSRPKKIVKLKKILASKNSRWNWTGESFFCVPLILYSTNSSFPFLSPRDHEWEHFTQVSTYPHDATC